MSMKARSLFSIRDDITPKIDGGDTSFTLNARDYKGALCIMAELINNHPQDSRVGIAKDGVCQTLSSNMGQGGGNTPMVMEDVVVRRLTPLECERLQGFPCVREVKFSQMTKDEYIAYNLCEKNIIADVANGIIYSTRGPGGMALKEPKELSGTELNGYRAVHIVNGKTKILCRVHRIIWIAANGIIPDGYVVDHINNDKKDNRISNLQLLTPQENSRKAKDDGLYLSKEDAPCSKITNEIHDEIQYVYGNSDITIRQLSERYGISKSRVHQIIHEHGWTDIGEWVDSKGKKHKDADSPRYKALGNSIALPFWEWMAARMIKCLKDQGTENPTMASLFDGIGGFPLVYSRCGCVPVWASEIEEFPIAVTKKHFPDKEDIND